MQNASGKVVELYIPRKCSYTNKILAANDTAAVQINVGDIDPETGLYTKSYKTYALCGYLRSQAEADMGLSTLISEAGSTTAKEE
jgi:small subunit ribosomal protein S21e